MRISLKQGVRLTGLSPQMTVALMVIAGEWEETESDGLVVTSCNDSLHSNRSKHYRGDALDIRTKPTLYGGLKMPIQDRQGVANNISRALGQDFDVILEHVGSDNEHLHVEYDPRKP